MRIGTIDRITTEGDLVHVFVHVDGDVEGPYPVLDPWGVRVDIADGQPMMLVAIDGALAEFAALPAFWRKDSESAQTVAFKSDADAVNDRVEQLQTAVNALVAIYNTHAQLGAHIPNPPLAVPAATTAIVNGTDILKAR